MESVKLYADVDNEKAKSTYFKLGMKVIPGKFYSYDFVLGSPEIPKSSQFQIESGESRKAELEEWIDKKQNAL